MKKNFKTVVLSCLICICIFAGSALPVQAWNPATCEHPNGYVTSVIPVPTGVCYYEESGHYRQYGIEYACLKCEYEFFTDTYFEFEEHELGGATIVLMQDGTSEVRYYCVYDGCDWYGIYE